MFNALRMSSLLKCTILAVGIAVGSGSMSAAQEVTPEHTAAAKAAMKATGATARLDRILPEIASFTKTGLIANRPDIESQISIIVDEVAIELAARRGALENEAAAVYTTLFTQAELTQIEEFFSGEAGTKFLALTPNMFQQIDQISKVWRNGITRDLQAKVQERMVAEGLQ